MVDKSINELSVSDYDYLGFMVTFRFNVHFFSLVFAFTLLAIAQGISFPLSINLLLAPHTHKVGTISALSGSVQMCLSGLLGGYLVKKTG